MDTIQSPNSSGQGYCDTYSNSPYYRVALQYGYAYSHSTPVTYMDGKTLVWHTFKNGEHNLSFSDYSYTRSWSTSCSTASSRRYTGYTFEQLSKHLANKRRRYPEL